MSPMEGRSLMRGGVILLVLSLVRVGLDHRRGREVDPAPAPNQLEELRQESLALRESEERRNTPLGPGETLDPNRSSEEELDRLPGVGPATARALVESREEEGGFFRPSDLLRVRGIGPATLEKISPHLDFAHGLPMELKPGPAPRQRGVTTRTRPLTGPGFGRDGIDEDPELPLVNVNRASGAELQSLPGIGPSLAERILDFRAREGPFRAPEDLLRVSGIGPGTLERIRSRLSFDP